MTMMMIIIAMMMITMIAMMMIIIATMIALASTPPVELDAAVCLQQPSEAASTDCLVGSHLDEPPLTPGSFLVHTRGYEATTGR